MSGNLKKPRVRFEVIVSAVAVGIPLAVGVEWLFFNERAESQWSDHHRPNDSLPFSLSFDGDGPINVTEGGIALKGYDVVAYHTEEQPVEGSIDFETEYEGAVFRFSSEENRQRFEESPERYLPAYGGFCALGVANGYKDDMHPAAFVIVDGRLYFNLDPHINDYWRLGKETFIARGDENWPELANAPGYGRADGR